MCIRDRDRILDKNGGYIKNWGKMESWGQDTSPYTLSNRVVRGYHSPRKFADANTTLDFPYFGFRPVLEVLNPDTLGTDGLKAVTLDLGGGKLGGSPDTIQIIVKTGESFTAPASDGLTLSLIHISEPTRRTPISYAVFCLKKKKRRKEN